MYAVKAIYDGVNFKPKQPISVKGEYEVVITFIEPIIKATKKNPSFLCEPDSTKVPTIGEWDGIIAIPDDFNEPLEEMKEYMY
jgi:predicted DNA-binding antitoxin AbrB/MazE fold protein